MNKLFLKGSVQKKEGNKYRVLASTSSIDRQGDSIDQKGWDLTNFKSNPVMLWAHNYDELPVAKVTTIEITDSGLEADFEFASLEANPKAQQIKALYDGGFLNAVSVGLIPKERNGNVITSSELLEISFVPVPANQDALRRAIETKSFDSEIIKELEKGEVTDELTADQVMEKKYQNYRKVSDVCYAFAKVYFEEEKTVEAFGTLLNETIGILQGIVDSEKAYEGASIEEGSVTKAISQETTDKAIENLLEKSGKVLSKKTLQKLDASIESMRSSITVLEELKNQEASSQEENGKEEIKEEVEEKSEESVTLPLSEFMKSLQQNLKASDRNTEIALGAIKGFLDRKGK